MNEELKKIFGGRGIDTPYERTVIDHRPNLSHIYESVYSEGVLAPDEILPLEIDDFAQYSPSKTYSLIKEAQTSHKELLAEMKKTLSSTVVPVDEETAKVIGSSTITFEMYDDAIFNSDLVSGAIIKAFEAYHTDNMKGKVEGILYREYKVADKELETMHESFLEQLGDKMDVVLSETAEDPEKIISEHETEYIKQWAKYTKSQDVVEAREKEVSEIFDYAEDLPELKTALDKAKSDVAEVKTNLRPFLENPFPAYCKVLSFKAEQSKSLADRCRYVIIRSVNDFYEGTLQNLLRKLVQVKGFVDNLDEFNKEVDKTLKCLEAIQKALELISIGGALDITSLGNIAISTILKALGQFFPLIFAEVSKLKNTITQPIKDWLDSFMDDPEAEIIPMDILVDMLLDCLDSIEEQFKDIITDLYSESVSRFRVSGQKLDLVSKCKAVRDFYWILDVIIGKIRELQSSINSALLTPGEYVKSAWLDDLIQEYGWTSDENDLERSMKELVDEPVDNTAQRFKALEE